LGSELSYNNLLKFSFIVIFASFVLGSNEANGQASSGNSQADTIRKSPLRLKDVSGNPYDPAPKAPLFLYNPSNIK